MRGNLPMKFDVKIARSLVMAVLVLACGGGGDGGNPTGPTPPPTISVASVAVALPKPAIFIGDTTTATATAKDASGNVLTGRAVTWSSDNGSIATVSTGGVVSAVSAGTASITGTSEGKTGTSTITITPVPADVTPPSLVSFTMTPLAVDVTSGAATITATMHLTDAGVGIARAEVSLVRPHGNAPLYFSAQRTAGTVQDGTWIVTMTIPAGAMAGQWHINYVDVFDGQSNRQTTYGSQLRDAGYPWTIDVTG